jgi:hypothetical protein
VDENDDEICYKESSDGGGSWGAEVSVDTLSNLKAIASTSPTTLHAVTYASGNSRLRHYKYNGSWTQTDSLIYWPHEIAHIDAITIGDRDLIVFFSNGPMYGDYREAGIYGCWYEHGRWSDFFLIDVLDEHTGYAYRKHPTLSTANGTYFLTGFLSEGDEEYYHTDRFVKTSKDGQHWRQYMPLVCAEGGPAKLLVINAASGQSWPWSTGQQVYICGFDKVYESDATRFVGEINTDLLVDVSSRTKNWSLQRGVIASANTILSNHDGGLDSHSIINADNTLLLKREAGYYTSEGAEYAQLTLEEVDVIKETDRLPQRHKQVVSRDRMKWVRDNEADHYEEWVSQLVGYDNYDDDTETGYGGLGHTATQAGWWETENNKLRLRSNNEEGIAFATWDSRIMNGQVKAMIRIETAGNGEYAGVVFRAQDDSNLWAAYYDETTDKILLRRKLAGSWESAVASTSALSWSIDTWYGIMVDFRYSYFRVFYSADGLAWTQAFTYVAPDSELAPALEYGYVGVVGYGYSDEDEEEEAGYSPPAPTPSAHSASSETPLVCFVDGTNGRVFRSLNILDSSPVYEDLGVVDAGGLCWIALDKFDPRNKAMVCGPNGVWSTTSLSAASPTWTLEISPPDGWDGFTMVRSSPVQDGTWMAVAVDLGVNLGVWWTTDDGETWDSDQDLRELYEYRPSAWTSPYLELSSHDESVAWVTWIGVSGWNRCVKTDDMWDTNSGAINQGACLQQGAMALTLSPIHHRWSDNEDDLIGLWGGAKTTSNPENTQSTQNFYFEAGVAGSGTCNTSCCSVGVEGHYQTRELGCCPVSTKGWWILAWCGETKIPKFLTSLDGKSWQIRSTLSGVVNHGTDWPDSTAKYFVTHDGTDHPIKYSSDTGATWVEKQGNWGSLGYDGDIRCCAMAFI